MAIADDNLVIKNFMRAQINNPPYPQSIVDINGQYHESDAWLDPVIEKIDCLEGVTLRYYYDRGILSIVKYIKDVNGKDVRQMDVHGPARNTTERWKVVVNFINEYNAL
jgi:hypothetical protein